MVVSLAPSICQIVLRRNMKLINMVYGVLDVQRVAGNFHISVHGVNIFVAQMIFEKPTHVNVSHIIHDLSFGPKYPGIHNPLEGTSRILHGASGTFKYYIKVVPTEYRYISKEACLAFIWSGGIVPGVDCINLVA